MNERMAIEVMGWMKSEIGMVGEYQYPTESGTRVVYSWNPDTNLEQAMRCLRKFCKDRGYGWVIRDIETDNFVNVRILLPDNEVVVVYAEHNDLEMAICEAIEEVLDE